MNNRIAVLLLMIGLLVLITFTVVQAQTGSSYDLTWNTIDNGGGTSSNGGYTLDGTIGQPDAGASISNSGYTLTGGFWAGVSIAQYHIYLPVVLRR
jgi:hypothetical protein